MKIEKYPNNVILDSIETWIFDLDNTLYPASSKLFEQVSERIGLFISNYLNISIGKAKIIQKDFFFRYGTTLRGLMLEYNVKPSEFLAYVHDIDFSPLDCAKSLEKALNSLQGRKIIFTNADTPYANQVLLKLGLKQHFTEIFDIVAAEYIPKPDPQAYKTLIKKHDFNPKKAIFFEDILRNLEPAKQMGMFTVWVKNNGTWAMPGSEGIEPHYETSDLAKWLNSVLK
jgi:putative hydrolase of the HAD superfamily